MSNYQHPQARNDTNTDADLDCLANHEGKSYFLVADALVGRKIFSNELELQATSSDGTTVANFRLNGDGAFFNNMKSVWTNSSGYQMSLDPQNSLLAIGTNLYTIGSDGTYKPTFNPPAGISSETEWWTNPQLSGIKFVVDSYGDVYIRGSGYLTNAFVSGEVRARDGIFEGTIKAKRFEDLSGKSMLDANYKFTADYLNLLGLNVNNNFIIDSLGNATVKGNISMTSGTISWANVNSDPTISTAQSTANAVNNALAQFKGDIGFTTISSQFVISPTLVGNKIYASKTLAEQYIVTDPVGTIRGARIVGGSITSDTSIDITQNANIGNHLFLKLGGAMSGVFFGTSTPHALGIGSKGYIRSDPTVDNLRIGWPNGGYLMFSAAGIEANGLNITAKWG